MRKIFLIFILIFLSISFKVSAQGILEIIIPQGVCLSGIAIEYQTDVPTLLRLNPKIKNPDLIFAGDFLKVPASTTKIVILPGDTLSQLAKKYNTTIDILLALNPQIKNPDLIFAGDELKIPKIETSTSTISEISVFPESTTTIPSISTTTPQISTSTLSVSLSASPSSGFAPLTGVDLTANVSGTATGTINYTFYCNRADESTEITEGWCRKVEGIAETTYTAVNCCSYSEAGLYSAKVIVERGSLQAEAKIEINVETPPISQPSHPSPPPPSSSQPPSCQDQYASGAQTYSVTTKSVPKIYKIIVDPLDVEYLSSQAVKAYIRDTNGNPITSVSGTAITDEKSTNFNLNLISGTETDGVWQGSWTLTDSICQNYQLKIQAQSESGTSEVTLTFK